MTRKSPWPFALTAFILLFIAALIGFALFASRLPDDLIAPDYYQQELAYQKQVERQRRAEGAAAPRVELAEGALRLTFPAGTTGGQVDLYRPSDSRLDKRLAIRPDAQGRQDIPAAELAPGLWKVKIRWMMNGSDYFAEQPVVIK